MPTKRKPRVNLLSGYRKLTDDELDAAAVVTSADIEAARALVAASSPLLDKIMQAQTVEEKDNEI